jgi:hypothetical protein
MAFNRQQIEIVTTFVDNVSGAARKVTKQIDDLGGGVERATTVTEGFNASGKRLSTVSNQMTRGVRRFKMELLSIMFFGMMLNRAFMGLIRTSLEWMGVNEILTNALGLLFLPIAEFLLDYAIKFLNWVASLTEEEKKLYGWIVLVGIAMSAALMLFGQFGLGLAGIQMAFGGIGSAATTAGGKVTAFQGKLSKIAKFAGATVLFGLALKDLAEEQFVAAIGDVMMGIGLIKGGRVGVWLGVIGFTLKIFGDKEFLSDILAVFFKAIDLAIRVGEEIGRAIIAGITPGKEYEAPADLREAFAKALVKADVQAGILKDMGLSVPDVSGPGFVPTLGASEEFLKERGITIAPIYNVNVSDKREFEEMLAENNRTLTEDVRRLI